MVNHSSFKEKLMIQSTILEPPEVTGDDLKNYRHSLRMTVDEYSGFIKKPRGHIARLERLQRALTDDEARSAQASPSQVLRMTKARQDKPHAR